MADWETIGTIKDDSGKWESVAPAKPQESPTSLGNLVGAAVEPNLALMTGAVAAPVAGLAGLGTAAGRAMGMTKAEPADVVRKVQSGMTYEPRSAGGKTAMEAISFPFEKLQEGAEAAGRAVQDATGSAELAALTSTFIQAAPQFLGAKGLGKAAEKIPPIKEIAGVPEKVPTKLQQQAAEMRGLGFVLPPTQVKPSIINRLVEGWGGKVSVAQEASVKNQAKIGSMIKEGLGIEKSAALDYETIDGVISEAGKAYEAVKAVDRPLRINERFQNSANELVGKETRLAQKRWPSQFPTAELTQLTRDLMNTEGATPAEVVEFVKQLRRDSSMLLKSIDDPAKATMGFAKRHAAEALDNLLEDNFKKYGQSDLVKDYRQARTRIAQAYDVRSAVNDVTGTIDARILAKIGKKKPFTDELSSVAKFGGAFKQAAVPPEIIGGHPGLNPIDVGIALASALAGNAPHPSVLSGVLLRPAAAKLAVSDPYQRMFVNPPGRKPASPLAKQLLELIAASGAGRGNS